MVRAICLLCTCAVLGGALGAQASERPARSLPPNAFVAIDVPQPERLLESAGRLLPLSFLVDPRAAAWVRFFGSMDQDWATLLRRGPDYVALLRSFDRGITCTTLVGRDELFWNSLAGAVAAPSTLRAQQPALDLLLAGLTPQSLPLADSPVQASYFTHGAATLFVARKSRLWAFLARYAQTGDEPERREAARLLATVVGLVEPQSAAEAVPPLPRPDGAELLARLLVRPEILGSDDPTSQDQSFATLLAAMALAWKRVDASLYRMPDGTFAEHIDLQRSKSMEDLPDMLVPGPRSLGNAAPYLPRSTLAAMHVVLNSDQRAQTLYDKVAQLIGLSGAETRVLLARHRLDLGEAGAPGGATAATLEAIVAVLPPSAGSPLPEPALFLRREGSADRADRRLIEFAASLLAIQGGLVPAEDAIARIRTLGIGDDSVPYVRFLEFFELVDAIPYRLAFGGGFLSTTQVGPWLVLGCNPRAVREVRRAFERGDVLAARPEFLQRFPRGSKRVLEAFVDFAGLTATRNAFSEFVAPMLVTMVPVVLGDLRQGPVNIAAGPPGTRHLRQIMTMLGEDRFYVERNETGHMLVHEGGMLLSPVTWCLLFYAINFHEVLAGLRD